MHNVQMAVKGSILTIIVDLSQPGTISKTGKSTIIGSTGGHIVTMHRGRGRRSNIWYARVRFDASTKPHSVCLLDLRRL